MNTQSISKISLKWLHLILQVNFNAAVLVLLISSILSLFGSELFFKNNSDVYGPLINNLRFVLVYLIVVQLAVYGFYQINDSYIAILTLGVFLLVLIAMLQFYCAVNQIEIDQSYQKLFLYVGLSHVLYGGICVLRKSDR